MGITNMSCKESFNDEFNGCQLTGDPNATAQCMENLKDNLSSKNVN